MDDDSMVGSKYFKNHSSIIPSTIFLSPTRSACMLTVLHCLQLMTTKTKTQYAPIQCFM